MGTGVHARLDEAQAPPPPQLHAARVTHQPHPTHPLMSPSRRSHAMGRPGPGRGAAASRSACRRGAGPGTSRWGCGGCRRRRRPPRRISPPLPRVARPGLTWRTRTWLRWLVRRRAGRSLTSGSGPPPRLAEAEVTLSGWTSLVPAGPADLSPSGRCKATMAGCCAADAAALSHQFWKGLQSSSPSPKTSNYSAQLTKIHHYLLLHSHRRCEPHLSSEISDLVYPINLGLYRERKVTCSLVLEQPYDLVCRRRPSAICASFACQWCRNSQWKQ